MQLPTKLFVGFIGVLLWVDAMSCSDTLYRVGKDVSYRVYTAPLPGSVLVYGQSEGAQQLAQALAQSGHGVRFVDNRIQLINELANQRYDVVIASYKHHDTIEASTNTSAINKPAFLPVALNSQEAEVASQSYSSVLIADRHEIKHYLKAIHRKLKEKT